MSKLYFRYGAMNCGKSTALMQVAHNYEEKGKKVVVIKSSIDTKAESRLQSRIGIEREVDLLIKPEESFEDYYDEWNKNEISCLLVDEGSKRLLELADEQEELITICDCGKRAKFNARFVDGKFTTEGDSVVIDGAFNNVEYKPMCGKCYVLNKYGDKYAKNK